MNEYHRTAHPKQPIPEKRKTECPPLVEPTVSEELSDDEELTAAEELAMVEELAIAEELAAAEQLVIAEEFTVAEKPAGLPIYPVYIPDHNPAVPSEGYFGIEKHMDLAERHTSFNKALGEFVKFVSGDEVIDPLLFDQDALDKMRN